MNSILPDPIQNSWYSFYLNFRHIWHSHSILPEALFFFLPLYDLTFFLFFIGRISSFPFLLLMNPLSLLFFLCWSVPRTAQFWKFFSLTHLVKFTALSTPIWCCSQQLCLSLSSLWALDSYHYHINSSSNSERYFKVISDSKPIPPSPNHSSSSYSCQKSKILPPIPFFSLHMLFPTHQKVPVGLLFKYIWLQSQFLSLPLLPPWPKSLWSFCPIIITPTEWTFNM